MLAAEPTSPRRAVLAAQQPGWWGRKASRTQSRLSGARWKLSLSSMKRRKGGEIKASAATGLSKGWSNAGTGTQRSGGISILGDFWNLPGESLEQLIRLNLFGGGVWAGDLRRSFPNLRHHMILWNWWTTVGSVQRWICATLSRSWSFSTCALVSLIALTLLLCGRSEDEAC